MKGLLITIAAMTALASAAALAAPSACNIMPTADILEPGSLRFEIENDGYPKIGASSSQSLGLMEMGLTPRLEFGVDRTDIGGEPCDTINAKFLLSTEEGSRPAVAVGVMDLVDDSRASYYGVATKSFGRFRLHGGYISASYARGAMLGCDHQIGGGTYLLADWMQGDENYLALGISQNITSSLAVTVTHGLANSRDADDLTLINVSYTMPLGQGLMGKMFSW